MSKAENIAAQERFGKAVNANNLDEINDLVAQDCVDHDPAPGQARGPQGYIALFRQMISAFPDFAVDVEHVVADDENVAFAYIITGTHRGEFRHPRDRPQDPRPRPPDITLQLRCQDGRALGQLRPARDLPATRGRIELLE